MRSRIFVIAAAAVLIYVVIEHKPGLPDPTSITMGLRNQLSPLGFTLATDPEPPECSTPAVLKVHVIDPAGKPASALNLEADIYMAGADLPAHHLTLHGKGNGDYVGTVELERAGSWNVDLTTRRNGNLIRERLSIEVNEARTSPEPRNPNEDPPES
jgi:hypothetical protein